MSSKKCWRRLQSVQGRQIATLEIPRAKSRRQIFMTRVEVWAKNWAKDWGKFWPKFSRHFHASIAEQNDPPKFLPKLLPIITQCLVTTPVAKISKFHLRELLGRGAPKDLQVFLLAVPRQGVFCSAWSAISSMSCLTWPGVPGFERSRKRRGPKKRTLAS